MKNQSKVNELVKNGGLEEYKDYIINIINDIDKEGCSISFRYDGETRSSHWKNENGCGIRIPLDDKLYKSNEHILWIILHELGHHFQNSTKEELKDCKRRYEIEAAAWDFAFFKFKELGFPINEEESFSICKTNYLNTYK